MADPDGVQKIRERIIRLAREIEEFSQQNVSEEIFFREFLQRVVSAVGARAGAVWMLNDKHQIHLMCDQGLQEIGFQDNPSALGQNQRLLTEALQNGQARTYSPDEPADGDLPTNDLVIVAALQQQKKSVGVVEIFQRAETPKPARAGYLQFVEQMCGYACRFLDRLGSEQDSDKRTNFAGEIESYLLQLHRSLNVQEVIGTAANDGRLLLECDRLSVAVQHGVKVVVKAISGQDAVNQRSNLVRLMTNMCKKVMAMREPFIYSGKIERLAPQIEKPLADYIQESGSRMVMVVPLLEPEPAMKEDDEVQERKRKAKPRRVIGGLIVEQVSESQPRPGLEQRVEVLADHVATALHNAQVHQGLFLQPLLALLGRIFGWFRGRNLWKAAAAAVVIAGAGVALAIVPYDYRVEGEGQLMPVVQKNVFCKIDGEVIEILVESGQEVTAGQELLHLKNDELNQQWELAVSDLAEKKQLFATVQAQLDEAETRAAIDEIRQLTGKMYEAQIQITSAQKQIEILEERREYLTVRSPIDGVVATFQIEQKLGGRPVRRGEVLLEIMDDTSDWRLELEIPDNRIGHILSGQEKLATANLPVEFVLATDPETRYDGKLIRLAGRTETAQEEGNVVEAFVEIDSQELPEQRIGAEVTAKISCGDRALGYVLFGDVIEFCQKFFWL